MSFTDTKDVINDVFDLNEVRLSNTINCAFEVTLKVLKSQVTIKVQVNILHDTKVALTAHFQGYKTS